MRDCTEYLDLERYLSASTCSYPPVVHLSDIALQHASFNKLVTSSVRCVTGRRTGKAWTHTVSVVIVI